MLGRCTTCGLEHIQIKSLLWRPFSLFNVCHCHTPRPYHLKVPLSITPLTGGTLRLVHRRNVADRLDRAVLLR